MIQLLCSKKQRNFKKKEQIDFVRLLCLYFRLSRSITRVIENYSLYLRFFRDSLYILFEPKLSRKQLTN